jgi:quinol monooxygenase YgiN
VIICNFSFQTTPEHREAFVGLLRTMMFETQKERGCILYRYTADLDDETRFHLVENWQDEELMSAHIDSPHARHFVAEMPRLAHVAGAKAYIGELAPYRVRAPSSPNV